MRGETVSIYKHNSKDNAIKPRPEYVLVFDTFNEVGYVKQWVKAQKQAQDPHTTPAHLIAALEEITQELQEEEGELWRNPK